MGTPVPTERHYRHSSLPDWDGACIDLSPSRARADAYQASLRLDAATEELRHVLRHGSVAALREAADAVRLHAGSVAHSIENLTRSLQ
jgi:hypothetical protein